MDPNSRERAIRPGKCRMSGFTKWGCGPVAFIGTAYFDGRRGITNPHAVSFAGTISRVVGKATYTVNSDCIATFTTTDDTQHFDMR